jgi:hypothetical protein
MSDQHPATDYPLLRTVDAGAEAVLTQISAVLHGLRFGSVTIVVQDGVVVQIDRTEKHRLQLNTRRSAKVVAAADCARETRS